MPTTIVGQNGVVVKQSTRIAASGCPRIKGTTASLTVQVPAAGRLAVSGSGLKQNGRVLKQAGKTTVEVDLSRAGLASMHRHHRLQVKLKAFFTPSKGSGSSVSTTLIFR